MNIIVDTSVWSLVLRRKKYIETIESKILRTILEKEGYSVFEAEDGKSGLNLLKKEKFDLIILDVMMPGLSGWDVLTEITKTKKKEYWNKIMFLSVVEVSEDRRATLLKSGVVGYMTKPFDIKELIKKVKGVLK